MSKPTPQPTGSMRAVIVELFTGGRAIPYDDLAQYEKDVVDKWLAQLEELMPEIPDGQVVIDTYPLRRWFIKGQTELPNYKVLKEYLVENYKVCYFCQRPVKIYPNQVDKKGWQPNDLATIDHLNPRQIRKRGELSVKVLACHNCNHMRNEFTQYGKELPENLQGDVKQRTNLKALIKEKL